MRFSEKSFEIRFCASLSAAIMPFNRNPKWYGMTQAEERQNGIDAMLAVGGRLIMFQFKAQHHGKFRLDADQWTKLSNVAQRYPDSAYYLLTEFSEVLDADTAACLLPRSWRVSVPALGQAFKGRQKTSSLETDWSGAMLRKQRPSVSVPIERVCPSFGCYCPRDHRYFCFELGPDDQIYFYRSGMGSGRSKADEAMPPFDRKFKGIPISKSPDTVIDDGVEPIRSVEAFEQLLGDVSKKNLGPGLFGLFLPA